MREIGARKADEQDDQVVEGRNLDATCRWFRALTPTLYSLINFTSRVICLFGVIKNCAVFGDVLMALFTPSRLFRRWQVAQRPSLIEIKGKRRSFRRIGDTSSALLISSLLARK